MAVSMGAAGTCSVPLVIILRAHLLTTCEAGGVIPPSGQAVRSARRIALSAESARQCRRACWRRSSLPVRLADGRCHVCRFAANPCPLPRQAATRLRKPAAGSFIAVMDDASPAPSIFFCMRQKKQKRPPAGSRKEVIHYGDLSSGS